MSSTRVISLDFRCTTPRTLEEALEDLRGEGARVLAGGTDLLNAIKTNRTAPRCLVYVLGVAELASIRLDRGILSIGAGVRLSEIERHREVLDRQPALVEAVNAIGSTQIRNLGTLGGNLCNASPGADTPPILLVLDAEVTVCEAVGGVIKRTVLPLGGFFTGPKRTVLKPGQMLHSVLIPAAPKRSGAAFRRLARVSLDIAKINCAAYLERDGETVRRARVALGSVAPTPVRAPAVEKALQGGRGGDRLFREAAALTGREIAPIDDVRSSAEYRRRTAALLVREALEEAWRRSGGSRCA